MDSYLRFDDWIVVGWENVPILRHSQVLVAKCVLFRVHFAMLQLQEKGGKGGLGREIREEKETIKK